MYNSELKESFVSFFSRRIKMQNFARTVLASFAGRETMYNRDLSLLSEEQIRSVVDEGLGVKRNNIDAAINVIKEYVRWRDRAGYDITRNIFAIHTETSIKIRDQMVSSPIDLKNRLDNVFEPPKFLSNDCIYRVFFWLAFSGMSDEEIVQITSGDVNLQHLYVERNGHRYTIYNEGLQDFQNACNLNEFWFTHPCYSAPRSRADGDLILRGFRSPDVNILSIRPAITRKLNDYAYDKDGNKIREGYKLSYHRVYTSGIFYRFREQELMGIPVNFSHVVELELQKELQTTKLSVKDTPSLNKKLRTRTLNYKTDYERWKNAFDV